MLLALVALLSVACAQSTDTMEMEEGLEFVLETPEPAESASPAPLRPPVPVRLPPASVNLDTADRLEKIEQLLEVAENAFPEAAKAVHEDDCVTECASLLEELSLGGEADLTMCVEVADHDGVDVDDEIDLLQHLRERYPDELGTQVDTFWIAQLVLVMDKHPGLSAAAVIND